MNQKRATRPRSQAVKTLPFHGSDTGSIPVGVIEPIIYLTLIIQLNFIWYGFGKRKKGYIEKVLAPNLKLEKQKFQQSTNVRLVT